MWFLETLEVQQKQCAVLTVKDHEAVLMCHSEFIEMTCYLTLENSPEFLIFHHLFLTY
jgi:hypothetical protein